MPNCTRKKPFHNLQKIKKKSLVVKETDCVYSRVVAHPASQNKIGLCSSSWKVMCEARMLSCGMGKWDKEKSEKCVCVKLSVYWSEPKFQFFLGTHHYLCVHTHAFSRSALSRLISAEMSHRSGNYEGLKGTINKHVYTNLYSCGVHIKDTFSQCKKL